MEMSNAYLTETVESLASKGFTRNSSDFKHQRDGELIYEGVRHVLQRPDEQFALECLQYPDGTEQYFLEIVGFHGMMTYPFQLDSWKHRDNRVEFKFCAPQETGVGLSFILALPRPPSTPSEA